MRGFAALKPKRPTADAVIRVFIASNPARNMARPRKPRLTPPRLAARRKISSWLGVSAPSPWITPIPNTDPLLYGCEASMVFISAAGFTSRRILLAVHRQAPIRIAARDFGA